MKALNRLAALFAAIVLIIGLCACSQAGKPGGDKPDPKSPDPKDDIKAQDASGQDQTPEAESAVIEQPDEEDAKLMSDTKLFYLGHASLRIDTAEGKVIYIDPYAGKDYGEPADLVLVTHYHSDHYAMNKITKNEGCSVIEPMDALKNGEYQSFEEAGVKVRAVPAYNANHNKSECVGYVLEFDGIKLYHAGDTSKIPEMADLAGESLDYALLPMDDVYNMGPAEAEDCTEMIKAAHYIPIHTGPDGVFSEDNIAKFNPDGKIVVKPGETLLLSAGE